MTTQPQQLRAGATPSVGRVPLTRRRTQEGLDVDLIVAPALTDVAGPRIAVRPVAGLPLLHVDQPDITGVRYLLKECVERAIATVILLAALPVLAVLAVIVKLTSPGPVFFSQTRV